MFPALLLIPLVALYRVIAAWQTTDVLPVHAHEALASWLPGFSPLAAVALCAGAFLSRRLAFVAPLSILFASDVVINLHYGASWFTAAMLGRYFFLALICGFGLLLRRQMPARRSSAFTQTLVATIVASTFFYLATNTLSWAGESGYPQTFAGWCQALTTGLPGYLPSWYFYRNALVSDCLYSMVFVACLARGAVRAGQASAPALEPVPTRS